MSPADELQLRYLERQLDRMDMQESGDHLEQLEALAAREERHAQRMADLAKIVGAMRARPY